jgi:hypothetical protein
MFIISIMEERFSISLVYIDGDVDWPIITMSMVELLILNHFILFFNLCGNGSSWDESSNYS